MAKDFPQIVVLKQEKCPSCGDKIRTPHLSHEDGVIRAVCKKAGCGFSVDLFFLGALESRNN